MKQLFRPTWVEIERSALMANVTAVRALLSSHGSSAEIYGVVKANGYGHGIVQSSEVLSTAGVTTLCVASLDEALSIREGGVLTPILVFGGLFNYPLRDELPERVTLTVGSLRDLELIKSSPQKVKAHLKFDSGMNRIGFKEGGWERAIKEAREIPNLEITGVYSHFVMGDRSREDSFRRQLGSFLQAAQTAEQILGGRLIKHIANSPGLLSVPESALDAVRPGLLLYGIYPAEEFRSAISLTSALRFRSEVIDRKRVYPGETVSYGGTWTARSETTIAVVPVGYGDGYNRQLSNHGSVIIRGREYPIVGRVCMDLLMCDVGDGEVALGDEVVLIGRVGEIELAADIIAGRVGMTPHEVTTLLPERVVRRWI